MRRGRGLSDLRLGRPPPSPFSLFSLVTPSPHPSPAPEEAGRGGGAVAGGSSWRQVARAVRRGAATSAGTTATASRRAAAVSDGPAGWVCETTRSRAGARVRSARSSWRVVAREGVKGVEDGARTRLGGPPGCDGPCVLSPFRRRDGCHRRRGAPGRGRRRGQAGGAGPAPGGSPAGAPPQRRRSARGAVRFGPLARCAIDTFAQLHARLKVHRVPRGERQRRPGRGVAPDPCASKIRREAAEAPDLDAPAAGETLGHVLEHHLHRELDVALGELDHGDSGHAAIRRVNGQQYGRATKRLKSPVSCLLQPVLWPMPQPRNTIPVTATLRLDERSPVELWTSPADRREPCGPCGQPVDNAYALPTACPHSRASRPQSHRTDGS